MNTYFPFLNVPKTNVLRIFRIRVLLFDLTNIYLNKTLKFGSLSHPACGFHAGIPALLMKEAL